MKMLWGLVPRGTVLESMDGPERPRFRKRLYLQREPFSPQHVVRVQHLLMRETLLAQQGACPWGSLSRGSLSGRACRDMGSLSKGKLVQVALFLECTCRQCWGSFPEGKLSAGV